MRGARVSAFVLGLLLALLAFAVPARAQSGAAPISTEVESFDGTLIDVNFFRAPGLEPGRKRPVILVGHGWGGSGATDPADGSVAPYLEAGYNVLTWDARGFGQSGGTVMIDHPRFEGRDAQALISWVARRRSVKRDGRRDPVVGMAGGSYGGGIQLITAARDDRVDAITPDIAWNTLNRSLYQRGALKLGWDLALVGAGIPTSVAPGVLDPDGIETGNQSQQFYDAVVNGIATGVLPDDVQDWFREHGPAQMLRRIEAPTLITQGTVDTLFTLTESVKNYRALKRAGVPVKMSWHCGGHGVCLTETGPAGHLTKRRVAWFDRYLKHERVKTGPRFEWVDEEGKLHRSDHLELGRTRAPNAEGDGTIALIPGIQPATGALVAAFAEPLGAGPSVLELPVDGIEAGDEVVGAPRLRLRYSATGIAASPRSEETFVYAQLVDESRGPAGAGSLVVGNQATPIPIALDAPPGGETRTVEVRLETIASKAGAEGYSLQIVGQSSLYDIQRATGVVDVESARLRLPVVR